MTLVAAFQRLESSSREALATFRNSSSVRRAKDVWWLNEQIRPASAPIGTHSSMLKGIPEDSLAIELQTETGL